jgi:uncharacterized protein
VRSILAPLLLAATLIVGGCTTDPGSQAAVPPLHPEVDDWDAAVVTLTAADGSTSQVAVRVAATSAQRQRGLIGVRDLPDGAGMLFDYPTERTGGFWMKDTLVPLDIAFAGADGVIRAILTMTPCSDDPCPTYDPEVAYDRALEVPAGWYADEGIATGDRLAVEAAD